MRSQPEHLWAARTQGVLAVPCVVLWFAALVGIELGFLVIAPILLGVACLALVCLRSGGFSYRLLPMWAQGVWVAIFGAGAAVSWRRDACLLTFLGFWISYTALMWTWGLLRHHLPQHQGLSDSPAGRGDYVERSC